MEADYKRALRPPGGARASAMKAQPTLRRIDTARPDFSLAGSARIPGFEFGDPGAQEHQAGRTHSEQAVYPQDAALWPRAKSFCPLRSLPRASNNARVLGA
jgi:hypothetical protein